MEFHNFSVIPLNFQFTSKKFWPNSDLLRRKRKKKIEGMNVRTYKGKELARRQLFYCKIGRLKVTKCHSTREKLWSSQLNTVFQNQLAPLHFRSVFTHWTYWLQIHSELFFQSVALSGNYEIVAISTDKNTFLLTLIIKLQLYNPTFSYK